jgi:uncharacterized protein YndB with AHSA1/START domain
MAAQEADTKLSLPSDSEILLTRKFAAPRALVFATYADPKAIPLWWGTKDTETRVEQMELRPRGTWRFIQRDREGKEHVYKGEYREVIPPALISSLFESDDMPGLLVVETVRFEEEIGRTRMTVHMLFRGQSDRDTMLKAGLDWAEESFDRLEQLIEGRKAQDGERAAAASSESAGRPVE